jgi:hypothetical protein
MQSNPTATPHSGVGTAPATTGGTGGDRPTEGYTPTAPGTVATSDSHGSTGGQSTMTSAGLQAGTITGSGHGTGGGHGNAGGNSGK